MLGPAIVSNQGQALVAVRNFAFEIALVVSRVVDEVVLIINPPVAVPIDIDCGAGDRPIIETALHSLGGRDRWGADNRCAATATAATGGQKQDER